MMQPSAFLKTYPTPTTASSISTAKKYTVIGVLSETGSTVSDITLDNAIFVPYNSAVKYVLGSNNATPKIIAVADDVNQMETTISDIETLLAELYPKGSFTVSDAGSQVAASQQSANTMSILLIAVASVVFVVGGIGIMNVLFVSVKERTREIWHLKGAGQLPQGYFAAVSVRSQLYQHSGRHYRRYCRLSHNACCAAQRHERGGLQHSSHYRTVLCHLHRHSVWLLSSMASSLPETNRGFKS